MSQLQQQQQQLKLQEQLDALPAPSGQVLCLISALSQTANHDLHVQAIAARDQALSTDPTSYSHLCLQLAVVMVLAGSSSSSVAGSSNNGNPPHQQSMVFGKMDPSELEQWRQQDAATVLQLERDPTLWIPLGQMAGLILKNALLRPPILENQPPRPMTLSPEAAQPMKQTLLLALCSRHDALRAVASTVVATVAVSMDALQPHLDISQWPDLVPTLVNRVAVVLQHQQGDTTARPSSVLGGPEVEGSLRTVTKIMEDGPDRLSPQELDQICPVLIQLLSLPSLPTGQQEQQQQQQQQQQRQRVIVLALQSLQALLAAYLLPSTLVLHFDTYLAGLSALAADCSPAVRCLVCKSIVTLLEQRTELIANHQYFASVCQFMLQSTTVSIGKVSSVAMEATEFWLTFCHLDEDSVSAELLETVANMLPHLVPVLVKNMVYGKEQQETMQQQNTLDLETSVEANRYNNNLAPVFHKSRAGNKHASTNSKEEGTVNHSNDSDDDDLGDDDDDEDEDGNEWTLRKCSAASLDSLSNLYGPEVMMPCLLPTLQEGLQSQDPWVQEASILALGAAAEGCGDAMAPHLRELFPFLLHQLALPEDPTQHQQQLQHRPLPQLQSIASWCIGRYAPWAVEQVQTGTQGHLLAQLTEIFLGILSSPIMVHHPRVQVAVGSAFGALLETAGDLMAPYLQPVYEGLSAALVRYRGKSLLMLIDVFGILADYCGPATAEPPLPEIYVPPLLRMWDGLAQNDCSDRTLLPLMECLASISTVAGSNFQPYALTAFDNACGMIEQNTLLLADVDIDDEDADPIICATDLFDGLVEGLKGNFPALVASSERYGPHFLTVLLQLCGHEVSGVRMSALALVGDLARHAPALLEPALTELLKEAIRNMDPVHPSVSTNAVWAIGEICLQCQANPAPLEPFAGQLMQNLICLLMGNGVVEDDVGGAPRGTEVPGLAENAAACVGRLALANPQFVSPDLPRFILGWCEGMTKITDPTERRDAFSGFVKSVYVNPAALFQEVPDNLPRPVSVIEAITSILFAVTTWHMPTEWPTGGASVVCSSEQFFFRPFPPAEATLGQALMKLLQDMKAAVDPQTWRLVEKELPVNVRKLLRETYGL